jgi:hypothetical protein
MNVDETGDDSWRASMTAAPSAAMFASTAAIRPPAIATSRVASSLTEGSITRPPLTMRSWLRAAANSSAARANTARVAAAARTNWRQFIMVKLPDSVSWDEQCADVCSKCAAGAAPDARLCPQM